MTDTEKRERELFRSAAEKWGVENEVVVALEEMSELQKELCKLLRGRPNHYALLEELADTSIMLDSLCALLNLDPVMENSIRADKIARLADRVRNDGPK